MVKIKISYFYQIRFFKPNQLPISTALSDPKWYHDFKNQDYIFKDKRGVINGVRYEYLNPQTSECTTCEDKSQSTDLCPFLLNYYNYLSSLDFNSLFEGLSSYASELLKREGITETPEIILIVHEAPTNPCSERVILKRWFIDNGFELEEFSKQI